MYDRRSEQLGAATGIVFVVLLVISIFALPMPPDIDEPAGNVATYFHNHQDGIRASTFIGMIAGFFFLWFLGSLRSFLRVAEGPTGRLSSVLFGGGVATAALATVASTAMTLGALRPETNPQILQILYDLNLYVLPVGGFTLAAYAAAGGMVVLRSRVLPVWLGWGGLLVGLLQLLSAIAIFGSKSGAFNPHDGFVAFAAFIGFVLWTLAASVLLVRRAGLQTPAAAPAP
jgi:Domain of unknown function (DUF4386)